MPIFSGTASVIGNKHLGEVEAENAEDAYDKLTENGTPSLCYHCNNECSDPELGKVTVYNESGETVIDEHEEYLKRNQLLQRIENCAHAALNLIKSGNIQMAIDCLEQALYEDG